MKQRKTSYRQGFTVVEILIVVMIIALLMAGVAYMVLKPQEQAKIRQTRMVMEAVKSMVEELRLANDLDGFYPYTWAKQIDFSGAPLVLETDPAQRKYPPPHPGLWQTTRQVQNTRVLMQKLMSVPANKTALAKLPAELFQPFPLGNGDDPSLANVPVPVDGWGAPIIYVPAGGLAVREQITFERPPGSQTYISGPKLVTSAGPVFVNDPLPMGAKGFWVSGGADRNFGTDKDNVYSFEN